MTKQEWIHRFISRFNIELLGHDRKVIQEMAERSFDLDDDPEDAAMDEFENWLRR